MTNPKSDNSKLKTQNSKLPEGWLEIGQIVAPQGLRGEMRVYPDTDFPERFEVPGTRWLLRPNEAEPQPIELLSGRYVDGKNLYVIKLAGIENCNQVEELRGCKLLVPLSSRPQLGEDEYHVADLVGLQVFMQESGEFVGVVVDVLTAGNDLLEVKLQRGEEIGGEGDGCGDKGDKGRRVWETKGESIQNPKSQIQNPKSSKTVLIPFVKAIAPVVDLESRRIEITPPAGLLGIND
ncbi:MAG: ribosome maturation factor RimM [Heteroscytonema crispum UTEX LB 1556]